MIHRSYDLSIEQQKNIVVILDSLCEQGIAVMTVGDGLEQYLELFQINE